MTALQSEPSFAAIVDRHIVATGVRTVQSLESVLGFVVSIEAELEALLQDQGIPVSSHTRNNPKANAGLVGSAGASGGNVPSKSPDAKTGKHDTAAVRTSWNTEKGCRFGKACKFKHPFAKVSEGLCFVCGAKQHNSKNCPYSSCKPGPPPKGEGKDGGKKGGKDKKRSGSQNRDASRAGSGNRSSGGDKPSGSGTRPHSGDRKGSGSAPKSPSAKSAGVTGENKGAKPNTPRAANPARALSAALDFSTGGEGLLDSGASHVIAPLEELPDSEKSNGQRVALTLASGRPTDSVILNGEVYAQRVRKMLVPFGKLIRQTGLVAVWSRSGLMLMAVDESGQLRLVCRPTMRQGGMPHVPLGVVQAFRVALKQSREKACVLSFEDWETLLGSLIPVCETTFSVREDDMEVHGKSNIERLDTIASPDVHEGSLSELRDDKLSDAVERLTQSAERIAQSLESCCLSARVDSLVGPCRTVNGSSDDLASAQAVHGSSDELASAQAVHETSNKLASAQDRCAPVVIASTATRNTAEEQKEVARRVESYLLPSTASRTNLGERRVQSLLLGLYTRRGSGITRRTRCFPLLDELHALARTCSVPVSDSNNVGRSTVFVCGQFEGGEHAQGKRISVVYFTPVGFRNVASSVHDDLRSLGFPVDSLLQECDPVKLNRHKEIKVKALAACTRRDCEEMKGKCVLIEYACYDDSLLSACFELAHGVAYRLYHLFRQR
eukprot:1548809-Amphidinium_carterae.3